MSAEIGGLLFQRSSMLLETGDHPSEQTLTQVGGVKSQSRADIFEGKHPIAAHFDDPLLRLPEKALILCALCEEIILKAMNGIF
jgi:hypothetical protein